MPQAFKFGFESEDVALDEDVVVQDADLVEDLELSDANTPHLLDLEDI